MSIFYRLFIGIFIISWGSILVRWVGDVSPVLIAFYRLFFSIIVLIPVLLIRKETIKIESKKSRFYFVAAGLLLAGHFYTWIYSLQLTTVANSIFLESTHPIFGWILSVIFLKEKGTRLIAVGMISGLIGMYLIISGDISQSSGAILGDLMAVLSAFCLAAYLLIARMMTSKTLLIPYLLWVYGTAAFFLLLTGIITDLNFAGFGWESWMFLLLLALGPNLIGHSLLNWASRKIEIFKINIALLAEPVLATIYAVFFFKEYPDLTFFIGALFILSSILTIFSYERNTL